MEKMTHDKSHPLSNGGLTCLCCRDLYFCTVCNDNIVREKPKKKEINVGFEKHKKGYEDHCRPPRPSFRWKVGQVWICDCGNLFKIDKVYHYDSQGGCTVKEWVFIEKGLK